MSSAAWLLDCGAGLRIAVGDREIIEVVRPRDWLAQPGAPDYCRGALPWQGRALPVMELDRLLDAAAVATADEPADANDHYVCVLNYLDDQGELCPVGIRVAGAPLRIEVDDEQVCEWPPALASSRLYAAALCCFRHGDEAVPIVDIARLCSAEFRELAGAA